MKKFGVAWFRDFIDFIAHDTQKKIISLRRLANQLYFFDGLSKKAIAAQLGVSRHFVIRWTQSMNQDVTIDHRGWPKGRRRRWSKQTERRIASLHKELKHGPDAFYWGPTAIVQKWIKRYPEEPPPPLRTIGQMLKDLGLSEPNTRKVRKGASRYLCYPEHTIYETLGQRVMEADFIGKKYITGTQQPIHFLAFSLSQGLIDGVLRIAQVAGSSLANLAGGRLRQPQVLEDLTNGSQRRWRLCRIAAEPFLSNRRRTPVKGLWTTFELFVQTSDAAFSVLGPSATATFWPSTVIYGDILVH